MMTVQITCTECGSSIDVYPDQSASVAKCGICSHEVPVSFNSAHQESRLETCPVCERKDFYRQKDFNRKIGVLLFVLAAIASIWTYGLSLLALYLVDLFLFRRLGDVVSCYKCSTLFRKVANIDQIHDFNHEMNDRIVYSDHNFEGRQLEH